MFDPDALSFLDEMEADALGLRFEDYLEYKTLESDKEKEYFLKARSSLYLDD